MMLTKMDLHTLIELLLLHQLLKKKKRKLRKRKKRRLRKRKRRKRKQKQLSLRNLETMISGTHLVNGT